MCASLSLSLKNGCDMSFRRFETNPYIDVFIWISVRAPWFLFTTSAQLLMLLLSTPQLPGVLRTNTPGYVDMTMLLLLWLLLCCCWGANFFKCK